MTMTLYGTGSLSPFLMRPVLAARAKGHELDPVAFEGGIKCDAYLALSPMGKMPLLVDGDFVLPESQPITDYLDAVLDGPKLVPEGARAEARTRLLVRLIDLYVVPHLGGLFQAREKPEAVPPALAGLGLGLGYLEHFRVATDSHMAGDSFTIADAAAIPLFFFFDTFAAMGAGALVAANPGLAAWWERAKASAIGSRCVAEQGEALKTFMGGGA